MPSEEGGTRVRSEEEVTELWFPPMLSHEDSDLLAKYCESYAVNRNSSSRWELNALLRAIHEVYQLDYDQEAFLRDVATIKAKLTGPTQG